MFGQIKIYYRSVSQNFTNEGAQGIEGFLNETKVSTILAFDSEIFGMSLLN